MLNQFTESSNNSDVPDDLANQSELLEVEEMNSADSSPRVPQKTKKGQKKSGSKAAELIRRANAKKKHTRQAFNSGTHHVSYIYAYTHRIIHFIYKCTLTMYKSHLIACAYTYSCVH